MEQEVVSFLDEIFSELDYFKVDVSSYYLDHVCYRVTSIAEYQEKKGELEKLGVMLVESIIGGRNIATFKLKKPFQYKNRKIKLIELPEPKGINKYKNGFEHAEFVIDISFHDFQKKYPKLNYKLNGVSKKFNPELGVMLNENIAIKLHHQSLEDIIIHELKHGCC